MRDAARSGSKRWALGNWDLRWKVTAVLAVPLAVAVGLGVSRITSEFTEANRLSSINEQVDAIPSVTSLSAVTARVTGSQTVPAGPGVTLVTDQDLVDLDAAITEGEGALGRLVDLPKAHSALERMVAQAKNVRAQGKGLTASPETALASVEQMRKDSVAIVESTIAQVSNPVMDTAKLRLVDSLNTRSVLVDQLAAISEMLRGSPAGPQNYLTGVSTERHLLDVLANRFPDGDQVLADLKTQADIRQNLVSGPDVQAGKLPIGEMRTSLVTSLVAYESVVDGSTKAIETSMDELTTSAATGAWTYTAVVIATILAALLLAVFVARSMIVPLHRLRLAALRVAESDLPHEVAQLRNGAAPEDVPLEPMPVRSDEEIGQLARAVDDIHGQALRLASDQAQMRSQVNDMFETLARRSKSLVDHQLTLIEAMEYDEKDPRLLENLFRLDHLAARMRRNGDNLLILAGTKQRRSKSAPVEIADVLRAAISEVEDYERVKLGATPRGSLVEPAASDLAHLFAELLDNALRASPPETDVKFTFAQAHDQGLLIEVADRGIGMPPAEMTDINRRLEQAAEPGPDTARHMGLFVVGRLAERHGLTVRLRPTFDTARDPGVTVTVHVPVGLIVSGAGGAVVPPNQLQKQQQPPQQQKPQPQQPQQPSTMQTRAITRTPGGNMMVTVDPGVSPPPTGPGGLPQRQPGNAMAQTQDGNEQSTSLRPAAPGQGNVPQRGKLAAANLPKRNLAAGGPGAPQRPQPPQPPQPPQGKPGEAKPAPTAGGLPQRQPGANGAPAREQGQPPRDAAPTREGGLPQRSPGANGAPPRDPSTGLPQRDPSNRAPQRDQTGGLPQRDPASGPPSGGLPQRAPSSGLPQRDPSNGLPQREQTGGLPQRDPSTGLPQRAQNNPPTGLPQRGGPVPQRDSEPLQRDPSTGLPQRGGPAPQRDSEPLQRDPSTGLPQRGGLPQREPTPRLPHREQSGGLPRLDNPSGGLPQRDPANGLPQRNPAGGLPQRTPSETPAAHRDTAEGGLPQRAPGLPQRGEAAPERPLGPNGLPQRAPGATVVPQANAGPGVALPQRDRDPAEPGNAASAGRDPGRHSYRSNPAKAASFFQTRLQPAPEGDSVMGGTPIFAEMMSAWLTDENSDRSQLAAAFESPGDEGWQAARRAAEAQAEARTAAGLPQRNPGGRLVPGGVTGNADRTPKRDPETIRSSLSRHQQGVRDGRAMKAMNLTGDKGDR
ncbi:HAMP domain-containing sensor histidine kinase [Nocardia rosealba]|uniref:HAMP domain-containing sensor histidine kinase n=1 Tax=Nocardia rosealba TaxID=2878563 RepID=UPI001CD9FF0D|nr:ATP-binding protein [Nocardia rosealba]MCA2210040.1 HAMP domain-containing protein [Nocardia rosealba]